MKIIDDALAATLVELYAQVAFNYRADNMAVSAAFCFDHMKVHNDFFAAMDKILTAENIVQVKHRYDQLVAVHNGAESSVHTSASIYQ